MWLHNQLVMHVVSPPLHAQTTVGFTVRLASLALGTELCFHLVGLTAVRAARTQQQKDIQKRHTSGADQVKTRDGKNNKKKQRRMNNERSKHTPSPLGHLSVGLLQQEAVKVDLVLHGRIQMFAVLERREQNGKSESTHVPSTCQVHCPFWSQHNSPLFQGFLSV